MAKASHSKEAAPSLLKKLWDTASMVFSGAKPLVHQLMEGVDGQLDRYVEIIEKRLIALALRGLALLASVLFLGFGVVFTLMDYGGVPRGIACLGCGCLGLMVLIGLVKFKNKKGDVS
jgi:hypothetical protein